ncbi:MAG: DUF4349 domain-containing protein [Tissierellia bacterium]|nr:DUF4349 domain-containing protein [Tissierellia bacterium]
MKKHRRYIILILTSILILSLIVGCSSKRNDIGYEDSDESVKDSGLSSTMEMTENSSEKDESPLEPEKVITTIDIYFETTQFEKTNEDLNNLIKKHKAYVENSNINYNTHYNNKSFRNGFYVIRIPKDNINSFKSDLNGIGNIVSENTSKEDVTKQYKDTESRLKIIEVKEERVLALLSKAEKIEDIIKLEDQLSKIIYEKEELKASIMDIDDKIDFTTMQINIEEVEKLTNQDSIDTSFGTKFINAISDSIFFFKKSLENLILLLVYIFPFALIIAIIAYFVIRILKKIKKSKE